MILNRISTTICAAAILGLFVVGGAGCPPAAVMPDSGDANTDGLIDAKIFTVEQQVNSFDTSDPATPQFASVAWFLFGTFPTDPLAVSYTVEYVNTMAPALNQTASWKAGEPIANAFATNPTIVSGYVDGIVGGEYWVRITSGGCQGGAAGDCKPGTDSTLAQESLLKDIRPHGTLTVTIEYE